MAGRGGREGAGAHCHDQHRRGSGGPGARAGARSRIGAARLDVVRVRRLTAREKGELSTRGRSWLRWGVDLRTVDAWTEEASSAVAVVRTRRAHGTSLVAVGDPAGAVDLALALAPRLDVTSVTLPRAAVLPPGSVAGPAPSGVGWDWMWTASAPPPVGDEERVVELDLSVRPARAQLAAFLAAQSPRHSARPDDDRVRAWLGVRAADGELLACAALYEAVPGVDLMASVAVAGCARGRGLGLAVVAAATRRSLRERPPVATVDLYADNGAARALYEKLGYRLDQEFTSYPAISVAKSAPSSAC
jgi:ribosomal protein S18 acetylase RimI-like enzyme